MQNGLNYQLQLQSHQVKLPKTFLKVFTILPGPNKSFVILGCYRLTEHVLVHLNQEGIIMHEYKFKVMTSAYGMVKDSQVIVPETRESQITVFNLSTHTPYHIPFNFMNEQGDLSDIFTFNKSKHICIVQRGMYNDNRFRLSYFASPLSQESQPIEVFESDSEWNHQHLVQKGNQESMVIWFKSRHDQQFEIKIFEVVDKKGVFNHYTIKNQIGQPYNHTSELQTAVVSVWQLEPSKFCLACISQKANLGFRNKDGVVNNNFIWNVSESTLREAKFFFDAKYNGNLIDIHSFGDYSVFRTFSFQNGTVEKSPVYYVDNRSQKIVANGEWECSYLIKQEYPGFDKIVVENQYENCDVSGFKMRIIKVVNSQ